MQSTADQFQYAWDSLKSVLPLELLEMKMQEAARNLGRVNILVAGKTGAGKTTLVNAVFGEKVGETGMGGPVTPGVVWHEPPGLPIRLCDTRGLETADFQKTLGAIEREIEKTSASGRIEDRLHLAWLCISERGARIEAAEQLLAQLCHQHGIPIVVVVTQAFDAAEAFVTVVREKIPEAKAIVPVMAEPYPISGVGTAPTHGLMELVSQTERLLPEAVEKAFIAAQQVDMEAKRSRALKIATGAAVAAGSAMAIPVPGTSTVAVLGINAGMVAGIAAVMGVPMNRAALLPLGASLAGGLAASMGGRMLFGEVLKLIPGFGSLAGAALEMPVAAATTYGLGFGFTEFLIWFHDHNSRMPEGTELRDGFERFWNQRPNKEVAPPAG